MDGDGAEEWAFFADLGGDYHEGDFRGISYVLQGSGSFPEHLSIELADQEPSIKIVGAKANDWQMISSDMVDINEDGLMDLVAGAGGVDRPEAMDCGEVYVIVGRRPLDAPPRVVGGPGPAPANPTEVRLYDPFSHGLPVTEFFPYLLNGYGTIVAAGDLQGDGYDLILTGPGPGPSHPPVVVGSSPEGDRLFQFLAYETLQFGVNVAAGDTDGDGQEEIITGPGPGRPCSPHVRGWRWLGGASAAPVPGISFLAYGTPGFGVNVACGDLDGDGRAEILTGPGPGKTYGPHVRGWKYSPLGGMIVAMPRVSFLAYSSRRYGVSVACGDIDGDGMDEIVTAPGAGESLGSHVRGWNYDGATVTAIPGVSFIAFPELPMGYGVVVSCGDLDNDRVAEILTAPGPRTNNPPRLKTWNIDGQALDLLESKSFLVFEEGEYLAGARVAAGHFYQYPPYFP
jgi:hypothetical protein